MPAEPHYSFSLPESAYRELATLASNQNHLAQFKEFVADVEDSSNLKDVVQKASDHTGLSPEDARRIIRALLNLHSVMVHTELEAKALVEAFTSTLDVKATESWKSDNLEPWKSATDAIVEVLSDIGPDSTLAIAGKARSVEHSHQNRFTGATIYTAIRPVFSSDGSDIHRMIVLNEIVLTYITGDGSQSLQLAMDASDVVELKKQCERAQVKSASVKKMLNDCNWKTYISNDPENDQS